MTARRALGSVAVLASAALVAGGASWSLAGRTATTAVAAPTVTGTARVVRTDLATTQQVNGVLGYASAGAVISQTDGTTFTALPAPGQVIDRGQSVFEVDGRAVPLFIGRRPAWRTLARGVVDGPDVEQLEQNLVALGFADPATLAVDQHFTGATASAVRRWQRATGRRGTGVVLVGDVVWAPGPLRVASVDVGTGTPARPGTVVLHTTSTVRVVTVTIPVTDEHLVKPGDPVTVHLPDGSDTAGAVASVAAVAAEAPSGGGPPARGVDATVDVTVTLDDPGVLGSFDQAPVSVDITDASSTGVLAAPINALVAPADGGYAVEVVDGSAHHLVPVRTGLFARTMVEISGPGIAEGTTVVVPAP